MGIGYKDRAYNPSPVLQQNLAAATLQFSADFLKSASFKHAGTKGEERELPIQDFFREHLPASFRVDKGEAVDLLGARSPQVDVLISDKLRNFPLSDGGSVILPAEALLVIVEVKSVLDIQEIRKIIKAAARFKALKPFRKPLVEKRRGGRPAENGDRFFYCVFAYGSDLREVDWARSEHGRFKREAEILDVPLSVIDRVYVANRGLLDTSAEKGFEEKGTVGSGLLQFYIHILNFLLRENGRRKPVPYLEYAGRMIGGWRSFRLVAKTLP